MPLLVPTGADFRYAVGSNQTDRPAAAFGMSVTPGNNTYGSYVALLAGASITRDCFGILININSNQVSGSARDTLITIGRDPAGGTSYTDWLTDLLCTNAQAYNFGTGGVWYYFPIFIKAGTSLAVKASVNNATVGTLRVNCTVFGDPVHPETTRFGHVFQSFGVNAAASHGTAITSGTTSEGSWTQLGAALTVPLWWWQVGWGASTSSLLAQAYHLDLGAGDASNKKLLIENSLVISDSSERVGNLPLTAGCAGACAAGDIIYGRIQGSSTSPTGQSMAAYGVG